MGALNFILLSVFFNVSKAGVTEIPPSFEDEGVVETVTDETWMPSNIFDVRTHVSNDLKTHDNPKGNEIQSDLFGTEAPIADAINTDETWEADSSPIFRAIRDFIFQANDGILEVEERNNDPTEEIVKIIEKGIIEATTAFFSPPEEQTTTAASEDIPSDISIVKIENPSPDSMIERIGLNTLDFMNTRDTSSLSNTTTACSNCYSKLQMCVQTCFTQHNCNDVERQARTCPPSPARLCNIFTQWGPVDECKVHEDCTSPLLCCSDGCSNKCSSGVWRN